MSIDVLTRLRAGSDAIEEHTYDAHAVLVSSRRALRRRRSWQALGAGTTAVAVAFSLALAGPVPVPGLGEVALPGSEQLRDLFGLTDGAGCTTPEPTARRSPVDSGTSLRPGVTFDLARARPMSTCFDVRIDGTVAGTALTPSTLTEEGTFWSAEAPTGSELRRLLRIDPLAPVPSSVTAAPLLTSTDEEALVAGISSHNDRVAWFETVAEGPGQAPNRAYLAAALPVDESDGGGVLTRRVTELDDDYGPAPAVTNERVAWQEGDATTTSAGDGRPMSSWTLPAWLAPLRAGEPELLAEEATAVAADDDEIVVATLDRPAEGPWTTTFTSFPDHGVETTVLTLEHPPETRVSDIQVTDDVLAYVLDGSHHLAVVPRIDGIADPGDARAVAVRLGSAGVNRLSATGDAVSWASDAVAYLLRDVGSDEGPDLVRIDQGGLDVGIEIALAGDRIAWRTATTNAGTGGEPVDRLTVGTLVGREQGRSANAADSGAQKHAIPAAPTVTVPENATFPTYD